MRKFLLLRFLASIFVFLPVMVREAAQADSTADDFTSRAGAASRAAAPPLQTLFSCPLQGGGDQLSRGFYVQSYPGTNLATVQVTYYSNGISGSYTVSMTVRSGAYDGPIIGTTQMVTVSLPTSGGITTTFDFGGAPVSFGTTVAFSQERVSTPLGGNVFYDTGPCGLGDASCTACPGLFQTSGQTPPLDSIRRNSVGITITQFESWWLYLPLIPK